MPGMQGGQITQEQMMLINSMQALMGAHNNQRQTSNSRGQKQQNKRQEKKRLPSLHIGNLPAKFYDLDLYKLIKNKNLNLVKALVVVDKKTNKSLNYGYAQFPTEAAAQEAQNVLNNLQVEDKVITVSMQQMDNKPNPKANILIRNLAQSVTQKEVFEMYKKFGDIQKCKLECFADGLSRGMAYVQFVEEKSAQEAIKATHSSTVEGKKLEVLLHVKRADNADDAAQKQAQSNNIFVQGFSKGTTEAQITEMFKQFGEISSAMIQKNDQEDKFANSAYVCFKNAQSAAAAVEKMNKQQSKDGSYLFVQHHVAKRQNDMASDKTKSMITQNMSKNFASNLFVKFIPTTVKEEELHKLFSTYGNIISIKIKQKGESRFNHAYVLYETVESCQQAIRALDKTRPFSNQPIDVEFYVSKVELAAERDAKHKEAMQKLLHTAIYDLKHDMMGGQRKYGRGNKRQNQQRPGTTGNRGGKAMPSGERKNSKDPRGKSQGKDKPQQPTPIMGQQNNNYVQVQLPSQNQVAALQQFTNLDEKKQCIGNMIYPCILNAYGEQYVGKITGMLLDEKVVNLDQLVVDQKYLSEIAGQAKRMLEANTQKQ